MTLHSRGSVLDLLEAHVTSWLFVGWAQTHERVQGVGPLCHPAMVTPQPPQGSWIYHLKVTSRANPHNRTAPTSSLV